MTDHSPEDDSTSPGSRAAPSNAELIGRLLALSWRYRWGCVRLLATQAALLATALGALQFAGVGIDLVRAALGQIPPPDEPAWLLRPLAGLSPRVQLAWLAACIALVAVARAALNFWYAVDSGHLVHQQIVVDLRTAVYDRLQRLSFRYYDSQPSGSLINRVTGDVQAVRAFVDGVLVQFIILILSLVCYVGFMLRLHVGLTIATLATTPVMWGATVAFSRMVRPRYDRHRDLVDRLILTLTENLQGVQVVKGFGREPDEIAKFARANRAVRDQQQAIFWRVTIYSPIIQQLAQTNLVVLLGYGGYLVTTGELALGSGLVVFAGLLQQFSSQVSNLSTIANSVQQSLSGARRVFEVLDVPLEIVSPPDARPLVRARGELRLEGVSFEYRSGAPVLREIDLTIAAGRKVAILGSAGAGKTTLLALFARFYDPTAGRVLVDGQDVRDLDLGALRRNLGLVFQESFLFSNTIGANIAYGTPDASDAQIRRAARIAAAAEFIEQLPEGYDTPLGEYGLNLSGGQRQRLAIARAILSDPPILLLDDPAASLDPATEHEVLAALDQAMAGRTAVIVAHRLSTLRQADEVVVLEEGRVTQRGPHEELLRQPGHYREVALSQGIELEPAESSR